MTGFIKKLFFLFILILFSIPIYALDKQKDKVFIKEIITTKDSPVYGKETEIKKSFTEKLNNMFDFIDANSQQAKTARYSFIISSDNERISGQFIDNASGSVINTETVVFNNENIAGCAQELAVFLCPDKTTLKNEENIINPSHYDHDNAIDDESKKRAIDIYNRANLLFDKMQMDEAIKCYTLATEVNPNLFHAYNNRGNAYLYQGKYEKAIEDFTKTIEIAPAFEAAYANRGNAYQRLGFYDAALKDFNTAIELNPNYIDAYYNKAIMFEKLNRFHEASLAYKQYLKYAPPDEPDISYIRKRVRVIDYVK